jgi:hypothetical protein
MHRFKVLCEKGHLPLITPMEHLHHITGMVSISGRGDVLRPIVILKNLQNLRELAQYQDHCHFATSTMGWVTKDLWVCYAPVFCTQVNEYRLTLPPHLREEPMLLIIDGHTTQIRFLEAIIFDRYGIDVLLIIRLTCCKCSM